MYSFAMTRGIILQVGDYSTEIVKFNRRVITNSVSLPIGTVTLLDSVSNLTTLADKMDKVVSVFTSELKKLDWPYSLEDESEIIGVGEVFEALGKLSRKATRYPLENSHNYFLSNESFQNVYNLIRGLDIDKTK